MRATHAVSIRATALFGLFFWASAPAFAQTAAAPASRLQAFSSVTVGAPPAPWRIVGLPGNKVPLMSPEIVHLDGRTVLQLRSDKNYGTVNHPVRPSSGPARGELGPWSLQWQWRLDQALPQADLRRKDGDDAPLKVCAMFDLPLERIPFLERNLLRIARSVSGEALPGATLCYVWDHQLAAGTKLANAYTARVRFMVLDSGEAALGQWVSHARDLQADFLASFGHESPTVPPLLAIVVGADTDNTGGSSLGFVSDLLLMKQ
ncbi:MAG: DUF3047 domain-containing protein [Rhodoferax sp.]|nr:DUF3047 domain-containing protein [Rhodoferax sp.]